MNTTQINKYNEVSSKICELYGEHDCDESKIFEAASAVRNGECDDEDVLTALVSLFDAIHADQLIDQCECELRAAWIDYRTRRLEGVNREDF